MIQVVSFISPSLGYKAADCTRFNNSGPLFLDSFGILPAFTPAFTLLPILLNVAIHQVTGLLIDDPCRFTHSCPPYAVSKDPVYTVAVPEKDLVMSQMTADKLLSEISSLPISEKVKLRALLDDQLKKSDVVTNGVKLVKP